MNSIRVVELFAGVGGFRLGLERASKQFQTIWSNQWEPGKVNQYAFACYQKHFPFSVNTNVDIATVVSDVPPHDFLVGGFPCQDYSVARTGAKGIEGKKGVLWWSINGIVKLRHPSYILLENVDRLLKSPASQRGRDFGIILRCLADEGYCVEWRVVNAADYGNAQRRRRTFIFAFKSGTPLFKEAQKCQTLCARATWIRSYGFFPRAFPIAGASGTRSTSLREDDFMDLADLSKEFRAEFGNAGVMFGGNVTSMDVEPKMIQAKTLDEVCLRHGVQEEYFIPEGQIAKWKFLKGAKHIKRIRPNGVPYFFAEGAIPYPDPTDKPARTMLTSESTLNRSTHIFLDYETKRLRLLTPVECERLNGFDDGWTANVPMPERMRYFIMGNALVVPLITQMGKTLLDAMTLAKPFPLMGTSLPVQTQLSYDPDKYEQALLNLAENQALYTVPLEQPHSGIVLYGTYRMACRAWIEASNFYNYPATEDEVKLHPELFCVRYLILANKTDKRPAACFEVVGIPQMTDSEKLAALGYPTGAKTKRAKSYILFKLKPIDGIPESLDISKAVPILGKGVAV